MDTFVKEDRPFDQIYKLVKTLGKGTYGTVLLVIRLSDQKYVAVKEIIIPKDNTKESVLNMTEDEVNILNVDICKDIPNCNIVNVYRTFYRGNFEVFYIEMELVTGGNGVNYLYRLKHTKNDQSLLKNFSQCVNTLKEIHTRCILHRDIKLQNLLYSHKEDKLIFTDFGLSCFIKYCKKELVGTLGYIDPRFYFRNKKLDEWSDIYSLSVAFYELLTGEYYTTTYNLQEECLTIYKTANDLLRTLREQYDIKSEMYVMITFLIRSLEPFDAKVRCSLKSVLKALETKDIYNLGHYPELCSDSIMDQIKEDIDLKIEMIKNIDSHYSKEDLIELLKTIYIKNSSALQYITENSDNIYKKYNRNQSVKRNRFTAPV